MASLNHVCVWSDSGWKKITVEELLAQNPQGGISAKSGLLMCELCGQYVTFARGRTNQPHFKHSKYEDDKNCEERRIGNSGGYRNYNAQVHELPLRINISTGSIILELGLLPIGNDYKQRYPNNQVYIQPLGETSLQFSFERIHNEQITYLNVGKPAEEYKIRTKKGWNDFAAIWPESVIGVDPKGTLFDSKTGKKLPYDADVIVHHDYLLLISQSALMSYSLKALSIQKLAENVYGKWAVYRVSANDLSEKAAKFFLQYHARLTAKPVNVIPLWPTVINSPYFIRYDAKTLYVFVQGDVAPHIFPAPDNYQVWEDAKKEVKLLSIVGNSRQQLLSVGRSNALKYTYIRKESICKSGNNPNIVIKDLRLNDLKEDNYSKIPPGNAISVRPRFDGRVELLENGMCVQQILLKGKSETLISDIRLGMKIRFIIGNDCIREISFETKRSVNKKYKELDSLLLMRLKNSSGKWIAIDHSIAVLLPYLDYFPNSKGWLLKQIKNGRIIDNALRQIKFSIRNLSIEGSE